MFALEPVLLARVQTALGAAWQCYGDTTAGNRKLFPLAVVSFNTARVADSKTGAANVQPAWQVTLVVRRGPTAAAVIDQAVAGVIGAVHNWAPGIVSGRTWNRFALEQATPTPQAEDGLIGIDLIFSTHARYDGQS